MSMSYHFDPSDLFATAAGGIGIIIIVIVCLVAALFGIAAYVLSSYGLQQIAKERGSQYSWMAWIPFASSYLLGWVGDQLVVESGRKDWYMRWWILGGMCASALTAIPLIGAILAVGPMAAAVISYFALYEIYNKYAPENKVLYLVLSILVSVCEPIFVFIIGRKLAKQNPTVQ
ncbi:MAG: hypothetical protein PHD32_06380 [Eubacteriales bacterium]|nr:hypothetical protein [Eubacteriales bacterium]